MTALGAALYFDASLVDDVTPLGALLDALAITEAPKIAQFCVPLTARREKQRKFRREELFARIRGGELLSASVSKRGDDPDDEVVTASVTLAPSTAAQQESRAGYRYSLYLVLGAAAVAKRGADTVVSSLIDFATTVAFRAGVIFPAPIASVALGLATGTAFSDFDDETNRVVGEIGYEVNVLADRIRTPEWGTFLARHHVEKMGGAPALRTICPIVRELKSGGAFLQLTERLDDTTIPEKRQALVSSLAPLLTR